MIQVMKGGQYLCAKYVNAVFPNNLNYGYPEACILYLYMYIYTYIWI